jgi:hypothetical protein
MSDEEQGSGKPTDETGSGHRGLRERRRSVLRLFSAGDLPNYLRAIQSAGQDSRQRKGSGGT